MSRGWFNEHIRHKLASHGVKTAHKDLYKRKKITLNDMVERIAIDYMDEVGLYEFKIEAVDDLDSEGRAKTAQHPPKILINKPLFELMFEKDPELAEKVLKNVIVHEMLHIKLHSYENIPKDEAEKEARRKANEIAPVDKRAKRRLTLETYSEVI